jgi:aspartyl-tRNA(Asn)/glutamyl-tRNA(Gln) amidotransferase subunit C
LSDKILCAKIWFVGAFMSLSKSEIEHIAHLSRIQISEEEKEKFSEQLSSILDYVGQLEGLNTDDVSPMARVSELANVLDEDKISNYGLSQEEWLANVPVKHDSYIEVKAVLE